MIVILDNGPLYRPKILVYNALKLHASDVEVMEETWYKKFEKIIEIGKS